MRLIVLMPVTNASSERSFSTMKRLKTYLRSTMGQTRLNYLMILNIEILDFTAVANEFVQGSEHRLQYIWEILMLSLLSVLFYESDIILCSA